MMHVEIANLEHSENIVNIMYYANHRDQDWSSPRITKYIKKESHDILIAVKTEPVGYAGIKTLFDDEQAKKNLGDGLAHLCQVTWIGVLPQYQRQGVARMLIDKAEEWSRNHGKNGLWLGCKERLLGFYEHLGLKLFGQYEEDGKTRYIMVKTWSEVIEKKNNQS